MDTSRLPERFGAHGPVTRLNGNFLPGSVMNTVETFGAWLRRRRRILDLTQKELAQQVVCSVVTIRKFEANKRRPSKELAQRLAECLAIATEEVDAFITFARTESITGPYTDPVSPPLLCPESLIRQRPVAQAAKPFPSGQQGTHNVLVAAALTPTQSRGELPDVNRRFRSFNPRDGIDTGRCRCQDVQSVVIFVTVPDTFFSSPNIYSIYIHALLQ